MRIGTTTKYSNWHEQQAAVDYAVDQEARAKSGILGRLANHGALLVLLGILTFAVLAVSVFPDAEWLAVMVYLAVIGILSVYIYRWGLRAVAPEFAGSVFMFALLAKLIGSTVRYWTVVELYDYRADAPAYHEEGRFLASFFRVLDLSVLDTYRFRGLGTTGIATITGWLYSFMPESMLGAFFVFAFLAFIGVVLFYSSARVASADGQVGDYGFMVFFLPSILFWPSSLGKDAWIFFCSGLVMWGWTKFVVKGRVTGLLVIAAGLLLANYVRPHIAAFLAMSLGAAYIVQSLRVRRSVLIWIAAACVMVGLVFYYVRSGSEFLLLDDLTFESLQEFYSEQQESTTQGGSSYQVASVFTPAGFAVGIITALARPFPWEAHNQQVLIVSLETLVWLFFCWRQRRVFWRKLRSLRSDPVAGFALFYTIVMLLALTSIGNFGILARQRVMLLPFLWMLFV